MFRNIISVSYMRTEDQIFKNEKVINFFQMFKPHVEPHIGHYVLPKMNSQKIVERITTFSKQHENDF